jgi:hypothetical protein
MLVLPRKVARRSILIITHLSSVHQRYDVRVFIKECRSLKKNEYNVNYIIADGKGDEIKDGVCIFDVGLKSESRLKRMLFTATRVIDRAIATNADVYHLHDLELLRFVPKLLSNKGKVIYDVHDDIPRQVSGKHWIPKMLRPLLAFMVERVENYYTKKCSGVITATNFIKDRFDVIHNNVCSVKNYKGKFYMLYWWPFCRSRNI